MEESQLGSRKMVGRAIILARWAQKVDERLPALSIRLRHQWFYHACCCVWYWHWWDSVNGAAFIDVTVSPVVGESRWGQATGWGQCLDTFGWVTGRAFAPLPSNRHHRSSGDCLEGKVCSIRSVLCNIVCNNCAQCDAHTYEQTNSSQDWVFSHWAHFTVLRFIFVLCITVCCMHAHA